MTDVPIRPLPRRRVLSLFGGAMKRGEPRVKVPAWMIVQAYGPQAARLLLDDLANTTWKLEGQVGDDLVFVHLATTALGLVRQSTEAAAESGGDRV